MITDNLTRLIEKYSPLHGLAGSFKQLFKLSKKMNKTLIYEGEEYLPLPGFSGYFISRGQRVIRAKKGRYVSVKRSMHQGRPYVYVRGKKGGYVYLPTLKALYMAQQGLTIDEARKQCGHYLLYLCDDGTVKLCNIVQPCEPIQAALRVKKLMQDDVSPAKTLDSLRESERLLTALVEEHDPKPLLRKLEEAAEHTLIPRLLSRMGLQSARYLADEAKSEILACILRGYMPTHIAPYMRAVANRIYRERRKSLQTQFADLFPDKDDSSPYLYDTDDYLIELYNS